MADSRFPDRDDPVLNGMVGQAPCFWDLLALIRKFAAWDAPVLIEGETGTGKELTARGVHYFGRRREHQFVPVNCGAIPERLIENELFGHAKGALTDASTLFLDEVDALSARGQVALLRFLQDGCYRPPGAHQEVADVRIVVASNRKLQTLVDERWFRAQYDQVRRLGPASLMDP